MIDGFTQGTLKGLSLIGWGADYPDPSNFLDYHFGSGSGKKFGAPFQDIVDALNQGLATADPAARDGRLRARPTRSSSSTCRR